MLISLALLFRTTTKMKSKRRETYEDRVYNLEQQVRVLQKGREKLADY